MGLLVPSISFCFILSSFVLSISLPFTSANKEWKITGKYGEKPAIIVSALKRDIKLVCELGKTELANDTKPRWSFLQDHRTVIEDIASSCKATDAGNSLLSNCDVDYDEEDQELELELKDITVKEFGDYVCHKGDMSRTNKTFRIREMAQLSRLKDDKLERSVVVVLGQPLDLYCNNVGVYPDIHNISWIKDGDDITSELNMGTGLFENFNKTDRDGFSFRGPARMDHRGNYTCRVSLKDSKDTELERYYPVEFSFFVRVKEGDEWHLPVYVLLGECALIGIFTLIINWKEKNTNEDDIVVEDSEDEDDEPSTSKSKGTQNNNSNGK